MIESRHPQYKSLVQQWKRCRNCYQGEDAVKAQGTDYLPKLSRQSDDSYFAYRQRASFFNAVKRTVDGLTGAVMRLNPVIENGNDEWTKDITGTGVHLNDFVFYLLSEQILMGRQGILVDHNGDRPYLTGYTTEQIPNWMDDRIILKEEYRKTNPDNFYASEYETQYRELLKEDGKYLVRIWKKNAEQVYKVAEEILPSQRGKTLSSIPFIGLSVDGINLKPEVPPMLGLADMNLSHYRTSADLEHGRHFTALPTPYVTGVDAESELSIGAESAWVLPDPSSRAGYLEFSGQGLRALETAMDQKRSMMASLGAQLLEGQKAGVEASETLRLRQNSEMSALMKAVKTVESGLNHAFEYMTEWEGGNQISVSINTDFSDTKIDPQVMTALMQAWQSGAISHETFLWNLKRGEILPSGVEIEDERDRINLQAGIIEED